MDHNLVSKYAKSAFSFAKKANLLDQFGADLKKVATTLNDAMIEELANPAISRINLAHIIDELAAKLALHEQVVLFLKVVAKARRINIIHAIEKQFSILVKKEKKILEVEVFSAQNLDEQSLQEIKAILQKKYSDQKIELIQIIKKDILGGVIIKIGSVMFDASLKRQLFALSRNLQSIL